MSRPMQIVRDLNSIKKLIEDKSKVLFDYVDSNSSSQYILYYKYLTHSDLPTFGKATKVNAHEDNLLYYLTYDEILDVEARTGRPFETTHQSNIGLPKSFWIDLGMLDPRETVRMSSEYKSINEYANVLLVNEAMRYFNANYTKDVFNKLDKTVKSPSEWTDDKMNLDLSSTEFTSIQLTQAVHGIGVSADNEFRKLRHNMFKNDQIYLLIEKKNNLKTNLFIVPAKNPRFFTIIGESNELWEQYQIRENNRVDRLFLQEDNLKNEIVSRQYQDKWRTQLAEEMMNFTINEGEVFCPFTYISADFDFVGTLYRASHIKSYADSNDDEKYDINNGLLLAANADALFDKHLITIGENKELIFSFLINQDNKLKSQLLLNNQIFKDILNDERMKYIAHHRKVFNEKEKKRKE